jgi:hypothetical protein
MVTLRDSRRGGSKFGCLLPLVVLVLLLYAGVLFGRPWFRYQQWTDEFHTVAEVAEVLSDSAMRARIEARADSLKLPPAAKRALTIKRLSNPPRVEVRSKYTETVRVPVLGDKVLTFTPFAESSL